MKFKIIAAFFIALAFTLYHASINNFSNYFDFIPLMRRAMDPGYAIRDLSINSNFPWGPRLYYAYTLGFLSDVFGLSNAIFYTRLIIYFSIALLTIGMMRVAFGKLYFAPLLALLIFFSDKFFIFAGYGALQEVSPTLLALPFAMGAVIFSVKNKPYHSAALSILSSVFHPLLGIHCGLINLLNGLFIILVHKKSNRLLSDLIFPAFLFAIFIYIIWIQPGAVDEAILSDKEYVEISAYIRAPHHLLFSQIFFYLYKVVTLFTLALISWYVFFKKFSFLRVNSFTLITYLALIPVLIGFEYLLTEVFVSRFGPLISAPRLIIIGRWISFALIAVSIEKLFYQGKKARVLSCAIISFLIYHYVPFEIVGTVKIPDIYSQMRAESDEISSIAEVSKKISRKNALFLTPAIFDPFTVISERAVVFSFKAFPLTAPGMKEWKERFVEIYGKPVGRGWKSSSNANKAYLLNLSDQKLDSLRTAYGADYAIVSSGMDSRFKRIYCSKNYCILDLSVD